MPRYMSFSLTTKQVRERTKTVTRRLRWKDLEPGTILNACEKGMGLKKGEKKTIICQIRATDVRREPLDSIDQADLVKEGFFDQTPEDFIAMFTQHNKCNRDQLITRIEFEYL